MVNEIESNINIFCKRYSSDPSTLFRLARNTRDKTIFQDLLDCDYPSVQESLLANDLVSKETLLILLKKHSDNIKIKEIILNHKMVDEEILEIMARDESEIRGILSKRQGLSNNIINILLENSAEEVADNISLLKDLDSEVIVRLSKSPWQEVRINIARRKDCPVNILSSFLNDKKIKVLEALSYNPKVSSQILDSLYKIRGITDKTISNIAIHPNSSIKLLDELMVYFNYQYDSEHGISKPALTLALALLSNINTSQKIINELALIDNEKIQKKVLENKNTPTMILWQMEKKLNKTLKQKCQKHPNYKKAASTILEIIDEIKNGKHSS